jgi:RNA polymerase sigma-70 factor (ECF subfamily)
VDRHWRGAWRVARGITGDPGAAEEIAQETMIAALEALDRFDPARGAFGAWVHRIAVNRSINAVRRARRHRDLGAADGVVAAAGGDEDARFLEAIAGLPPDQRAVLVLRFGLGLPAVETAAVLEVPVGTVHSRQSRALDALRQTMESPRA